MSDDEDFEAPSPDLGACSSRDVIPSMTEQDSDENDENDSEESSDVESPRKRRKGQRTRKLDSREWSLVTRIDRDGREPEEIEALIFTECKKLMEVTRLYRLSTTKPKKNDIFLWKHSNFWNAAKGAMQFQMLICPMIRRFGCMCQLKICRTDHYVTLEIRGTHDAESHAAEKDTSKFLKVAQIEAIRTGVRIAPGQSAKHLRRHLEHSSPTKRIAPELLPAVRRRVRKFRSELTMESLQSGAIDDSFGWCN